MEDVGEIEGDIEEFFKQKLPRMVWRWVKNPLEWPVARILADQNFRYPENQLNALLSAASDPHRVYGHSTDLYAIYSKILDRACPPASHDQLLASFRDILGALCVVKTPVNIHTITSLLCLDHPNNEDPTDRIRTGVLGYLQAVLIVSDVDEDNSSRDAEPIRFVHESFEDYLTDESSCDAWSLVNVAKQHRRMRRMEDLQKPNIRDIDPTMLTSWIRVSFKTQQKFDDDVDIKIKDLVQQYISSALPYACENWATHVSSASPECGGVYTSVDTFARTRLLYWLEVLSLLEMINDVVGLVESVEAWLKVRPRLGMPVPSESPTPTVTRLTTLSMEGVMEMQIRIRPWMSTVHILSRPLSIWVLNHARRFIGDLPSIQQPEIPPQTRISSIESDISVLDLLPDLKNFVSEFQIPIYTSSSHIYYSPLAFMPSYTSLSRAYGHLARGGPRPQRGRLQQWCQRSTLNGVAWSPDGQRIISGHGDGILRPWERAPLSEASKLYTNAVQCVTWPPNGEMIVSGSLDHTLQLWDSTTGIHIGEPWRGHTGVVICLAWSADGEKVVSGASDDTLRM
ncbi:hypothetical protein FRB93_006847 [Tulasnella sp. JGI-2019a]|nr:hypothetical protein FRB93_006847 [Tulasnella sp. JGI-2019a]